jgi:hypothetical protein
MSIIVLYLFKIYISNPDANEFDFKKAFELIDYLNEDKSKVSFNL